MRLQGDIPPTQYPVDPATPPSRMVEEATLIALLRQWDISYLTGGLTAVPSSEGLDRATSSEFLLRVTRCPNPHVRDATISLVLLHPGLAEALKHALEQGAEVEAEQLAILTLATLYLQRLWWDRLTLALGHAPTVPEEPFKVLWRAPFATARRLLWAVGADGAGTG